MKRLAAIYIKEHSHLFNTPQTINFGGKYIYSFQESNNGDISYERKDNPHYIEYFFNTTDSESEVTNVSAIVGQNGAGKTSILDIVRSIFTGNQYAFPFCDFCYIIEDGDNTYLLNQDSYAGRIQSIYYSPHFDYRYNPNFDSVTIDDHDISFDRILELDLSELNEKDTNESGWSYSPTQELLFKNTIRQLEFLASDIVNKHKAFNEIFDLPDYNTFRITIWGYKLEEREWNTPSQFRPILKKIKEKIDEELNAWHTIRKMDNSYDKVLNQLEINQYIIKRSILNAVLSIFYKQMEKQNTYLQEGRFPNYGDWQNSDKTAYEFLEYFVNNATVYEKPIFKSSESNTSLMMLVDKLYEIIDKINTESHVSNSIIRISKESAIEVLQLQRSVISELNEYYPRIIEDIRQKGKDTKNYKPIPEGERINGFVNFEPFDKRLSSGEHALLNLFSRLYDFLNQNLISNEFRQLNDHYILLIDEGDLGFHPSWKKKYVKSLLNTLPYFFEKLKSKPSIEIIFTTHDPLTLSDIPNRNTVYIKRQNYSDYSEVLEFDSTERPSKTFGANVTDLLADSFFIEKSLIGDFAFDKIRGCIEWLNKKNAIENKEYYKKIIYLIDEPIIQRKLAEMYDNKMEEHFANDIIDEQIERLRRLKK